jgi:hypothetical protein
MRRRPQSRALRESEAATAAEIEREILQTLCRATVAHGDWDKIADALANYPWTQPEHGVVYAALIHARKRAPKAWREELPAQATRMGFPDVDWARYSSLPEKKNSARDARLKKLVRALKTSAAVRV